MQRIDRPSTTEHACTVCNFVPTFGLSRTTEISSKSNKNEAHKEDKESTASLSGSEDGEEGNDTLVETLENILAEYGLQATMYLPSKSSSTSKPRDALIKSKKDDPKIDCEVVVDGKVNCRIES